MAPEAGVWEQWLLRVLLGPTLWRPGPGREEANGPGSRGMGPLPWGGGIEGSPRRVGSVGILRGSLPVVGLPFKVRASSRPEFC